MHEMAACACAPVPLCELSASLETVVVRTLQICTSMCPHLVVFMIRSQVRLYARYKIDMNSGYRGQPAS